MPYNILLREDLEHIYINTINLWSTLNNKSIFITGGTGFLGCWLLESLLYAQEEKGIKIKVTILTRSHESFKLKAPDLANDPKLVFLEGDVSNFAFPSDNFDFIIHAATDSSTGLDKSNPLMMFDTIIHGTRHTLDFGVKKSVSKFLYISSGAVYGKQPYSITHIPEDFQGAPNPNDPSSVYGECKRSAELLCSIYSKNHGMETKVARCFAFVGPYLPLNIHFAIGNFILDGLKGDPICIKGDGTPFRSYLYAADLVIYLLTILVNGKSCYPYNVGSDNGYTIKSLAEITSSHFDLNPEIKISQKSMSNHKPERYIPSIRRAKEDLNLKPYFDIHESIKKTINFHNNLLKT